MHIVWLIVVGFYEDWCFQILIHQEEKEGVHGYWEKNPVLCCRWMYHKLCYAFLLLRLQIMLRAILGPLYKTRKVLNGSVCIFTWLNTVASSTEFLWTFFSNWSISSFSMFCWVANCYAACNFASPNWLTWSSVGVPVVY